mmetsp:Transcript_892/g.3542  ORF Transcript_892/g.3542 Transcript_892/m.3542 type:complete len:274 (-) Transcript_892:85-906(-)
MLPRRRRPTLRERGPVGPRVLGDLFRRDENDAHAAQPRSRARRVSARPDDAAQTTRGAQQIQGVGLRRGRPHRDRRRRARPRRPGRRRRLELRHPGARQGVRPPRRPHGARGASRDRDRLRHAIRRRDLPTAGAPHRPQAPGVPGGRGARPPSVRRRQRSVSPRRDPAPRPAGEAGPRGEAAPRCRSRRHRRRRRRRGRARGPAPSRHLRQTRRLAGLQERFWGSTSSSRQQGRRIADLVQVQETPEFFQGRPIVVFFFSVRLLRRALSVCFS